MPTQNLSQRDDFLFGPYLLSNQVKTCPDPHNFDPICYKPCIVIRNTSDVVHVAFAVTNESSIQMPSKLANSHPEHTGKTSLRINDPTVELVGLQAAQWEQLDEAGRLAILQGIGSQYRPYVEDFYATSNLCVRRYDKYVSLYKRWRYTAIIGTGVLACLNFAAAKASYAASWGHSLPISASILAVIISVLANLESFSNASEQAQGYRESRELYLDAAQEFDRAWSVSVTPLGDTAQAYINAVELYRRIVAVDRDLRRSFKEPKQK